MQVSDPRTSIKLDSYTEEPAWVQAVLITSLSKEFFLSAFQGSLLSALILTCARNTLAAVKCTMHMNRLAKADPTKTNYKGISHFCNTKALLSLHAQVTPPPFFLISGGDKYFGLAGVTLVETQLVKNSPLQFKLGLPNLFQSLYR